MHDTWVLDAVGFELMGEVFLQYSEVLGVWGGSWVEQAIQELVLCNCFPCLINRLFLKSVQMQLRVVSMSDSVSIHL